MRCPRLPGSTWRQTRWIESGSATASPAPLGAEGLACALDPLGRLIAILEATADGQQWHPRKVFLE